MAFCLGEIQSVEYSFCLGIPDRGPLSRHIGQENESVRSRGNCLCNHVQLIQRGFSRFFFHQPFIPGKFLLEPPHDAAATGGAALQKPFARNHMPAENQPRIGFVRIQADAHTARLSSLLLGFARSYDAGSQCAAGCVQSAGSHGRSLQKSALLCCLFRHFPDDPVTGDDLRKESLRNPHRFAHVTVPDSFFHVKAVQSVALGNILGHCAGQPVGDVAVGLQDLINLFVLLRQILLVPEDLCRRIRRRKRVSGYLKDPVPSDPFVQFPADLFSPGVHPDRGVAEDLSHLIHRDRGPALSVYSDGRDLFRLYAAF